MCVAVAATLPRLPIVQRELLNVKPVQYQELLCNAILVLLATYCPPIKPLAQLVVDILALAQDVIPTENVIIVLAWPTAY
jgi:hypothetical protein